MKAIFSVVGLAAFLVACSGGAANVNVNHASNDAMEAPAAEPSNMTVGAVPDWSGPTTPGANELRMGSVGTLGNAEAPVSRTTITSAPITAD